MNEQFKDEVDNRQCSVCGRKFGDAQSTYLHRMSTNGHCKVRAAAAADQEWAAKTYGGSPHDYTRNANGDLVNLRRTRR